MAPFWGALSEKLKTSDDLEHPYLVPDISFKKGEPIDGASKWVADRALSSAKFAGLLSSVLIETGLERGLAQEITGKSLRKFDASAGDAFELEADMKNSLEGYRAIPRTR